MIGRKSLLIVISSLLSSVIAFFGLLAITNYLGKDVYGNLAWVLATIGTLNIIADLGFDSAHIKRLSEGNDESDCFSTYLVIKVVLTAIMVTFTISALVLWNDILGGNMSSTTWNLVILFILYFGMYDIANVVIFTFNGKMQTTKSQLIVLIDPLIRVPLIIFVSLNHMSDGLPYAYVFAAISVLLLSLLLLKRSSIGWKKPTLFRSYLKFALPLSIIAIASAATNNLDKILIGYFSVTGDVAYYSSAQTLLAMVGVVGTAVATLAFPSISRLHADRNMKSIRDVTYAAERYISMIAIPVVTFFVVFPTEISVTVFGPQFAPGGDAMRYLAISVGLILLNQVYVSQILGVNRPDLSAKITLGTFLVGVVLLLIFIPHRLFGVPMLGMSYTGAAIASVITSALSFTAVRLVVKDLTGTVGNPRILRHILAGVMAAVVVMAMSTVYHPSGFIALGIFAVVTVVAFFASLALLKEFTRADIDYFIDLVNPSKMLSYMGDEVKNKK